jgi:hypothetical protein
MRKCNHPTLHDLALLAAATLPDEFHVNDLVVACWHAHPQRFGLEGYAHPNSNAGWCIMGY